MKNFSQPGLVVDLVAPEGGVTSGTPVLIGAMIVIPQASADAGDKFAALIEGVAEVAKLSTDEPGPGDKLNWDDSNSEFKLATGDLDDAAIALESKVSGDTKILVKLTNQGASLTA